MILVIDYGMGNLGSVLNMLKRIGAEARLSESPDDVVHADKLILPGVGAFDEGVSRLRQLGYVPALNHWALDRGLPILGVCLGMQLLTRTSEEGSLPGFGWFDADVVRFKPVEQHAGLRVPHMGWNTLSLRKSSPLFGELGASGRYYFVHSFFVRCHDPNDVLATTDYGVEFASGISKGRIFGVQFHPEKSLRWGMSVMRNFVDHA